MMTTSRPPRGPVRRLLFGRSATRFEMLTVAVVVLLVAALFQGYLDHRKHVADRRQARAIAAQVQLDHKYDRATRSICVVLNAVPPVEPRRERQAIAKAYRVNRCDQILARQLTHGTEGPSLSSPTAIPSPAGGGTTTVIVHPRSRPTATVTAHPTHPAAHPRHSTKPPPTTPKPTRSPCGPLDLVGCLLHQH